MGSTTGLFLGERWSTAGVSPSKRTPHGSEKTGFPRMLQGLFARRRGWDRTDWSVGGAVVGGHHRRELAQAHYRESAIHTLIQRPFPKLITKLFSYDYGLESTAWREREREMELDSTSVRKLVGAKTRGRPFSEQLGRKLKASVEQICSTV